MDPVEHVLCPFCSFVPSVFQIREVDQRDIVHVRRDRLVFPRQGGNCQVFRIDVNGPVHGAGHEYGKGCQAGDNSQQFFLK